MTSIPDQSHSLVAPKNTNFIIADAHTVNKSSGCYVATSATVSEGFKHKYNVDVIKDSPASTSKKIAGDYLYNCQGNTVKISLTNDEQGKVYVKTRSGTIAISQSVLRPNNKGVRADLDRLLQGLAYRGLGL